jgi:hypothetical protein
MLMETEAGDPHDFLVKCHLPHVWPPSRPRVMQGQLWVQLAGTCLARPAPSGQSALHSKGGVELSEEQPQFWRATGWLGLYLAGVGFLHQPCPWGFSMVEKQVTHGQVEGGNEAEKSRRRRRGRAGGGRHLWEQVSPTLQGSPETWIRVGFQPLPAFLALPLLFSFLPVHWGALLLPLSCLELQEPCWWSPPTGLQGPTSLSSP